MMTKHKTARTVAALAAMTLLLLSAAGCVAGGGGNTAATSATAVPGGTGLLSSFTAKDLDGSTVDQTILAGKKLSVINVWATFCGPCIREMPELASVSSDYAEKGVQIVGVVVDTVDGNWSRIEKNVSEAKAIVSETGSPYIHLIPSASMRSVCGVQYVPTTFFVDAEGREVAPAVVGSRSGAEWAELIDGILAGLGE